MTKKKKYDLLKRISGIVTSMVLAQISEIFASSISIKTWGSLRYLNYGLLEYSNILFGKAELCHTVRQYAHYNIPQQIHVYDRSYCLS